MEMIVNGIEVLFIVIGGSACRDVIPEGDIKPRKTTDIDMVLVPQELSAGFIGTPADHWIFGHSHLLYAAAAGRYSAVEQKSEIYSGTGRQQF